MWKENYSGNCSVFIREIHWMKTCFILKFMFKKGKETDFYQADFIVWKLSRLLDLKIVISRMNLEKCLNGQYQL